MIKLIFPLLIIAAIIWWANAVSFPDSYFAGLFAKKPPASKYTTASASIESASSELTQAKTPTSPSPVTTALPVPSPSGIPIKQPDGFQLLRNQKYVYQTYNNCGPASLSMLLDYWGIEVTQQEIADQLRPYQQVRGIGDDKAVTLDELADYSEKFGLKTFKRPNGDIQKIKQFLENDIPVLTLAWLNEKGGFGHYRIIKGYDDSQSKITEDDSIYGLGQKVDYSHFLSEWQVFNYEYLIVAPPNKEELITQILASEIDLTISYKNALAKSQSEYTQNPANKFALFNQSISHYYLTDYQESIRIFEMVQNSLPDRLLWYQLEPVLAYRKLKHDDKLLSLTNKIFSQGNIAASELYMLRGEAYLEHGQKDAAKKEFEKALFYNKNLLSAQNALSTF